MMGVSTETYWGWEVDRIRPYAASWAPIIEFLGYDPSPVAETLGERLKAKRRRLGWSQAKIAVHLGWDETTVRRYENGDRRPTGRLLEQLENFLASD